MTALQVGEVCRVRYDAEKNKGAGHLRTVTAQCGDGDVDVEAAGMVDDAAGAGS